MLYLAHSTPGRFRLQGDSVLGTSRLLRAAKSEFEQTRGVTSVSTNCATGSIVVLYDPRQLTVEDFWQLLRQTGFVAADICSGNGMVRTPAGRLVSAASRGLLGRIVERSADALIGELIRRVS